MATTIPSRPPSRPMNGLHAGLPQAMTPADAARLQAEQDAWQAQTLTNIRLECDRNLEESRSNYEPNSALSPVLQESMGSPVGSKAGSKESVRAGSKDSVGSKVSVRKDSKVQMNENPDIIALAPSPDDGVNAPSSPTPEKIVRRAKMNGGNWRRTMTRTISMDSSAIVDTPEFMWQKYLKHFTSSELDWISAQFDAWDEDLSGTILQQQAVQVATTWMKRSHRCENPQPSEEIVKAALAECSTCALDNLSFEHVVLFVKQCETRILDIDEHAGFPEENVLEYKSVFKDFCKAQGIGSADVPPALSTLDTFAILEELGRETGDKDSQEKVIAIIKAVDVNASGDIDFSEFLHLLQKVQEQDSAIARRVEKDLIQQSGFSDPEVENFAQLFDLYQDEDGTFTLESLRDLFSKIDVNLTPERRKQLAGMVHKLSDDNILTLGQFLYLLHGLLEEDFAEIRTSANQMPERAAYNPMSSNNVDWDTEMNGAKMSAGEWLEKNREKLKLGEGKNWVSRMIRKKSLIKNAGQR